MMSDAALLVRPSSYQDWRGLFYWAIGDSGSYYPAMELSCQQVKYLNELFYMYYYNTGQTEDEMSKQKKDDYDHVCRHIDAQKPYRCMAF